MKFQSYLSTHKPIYAIFNGEVRRMVEKYGIGFGAHPTNVEDIASGFSRFLSLSPEEKRRMSENETRLESELFNKDKIINRINNLLWWDNE